MESYTDIQDKNLEEQPLIIDIPANSNLTPLKPLPSPSLKRITYNNPPPLEIKPENYSNRLTLEQQLIKKEYGFFKQFRTMGFLGQTNAQNLFAQLILLNYFFSYFNIEYTTLNIFLVAVSLFILGLVSAFANHDSRIPKSISVFDPLKPNKELTFFIRSVRKLLYRNKEVYGTKTETIVVLDDDKREFLEKEEIDFDLLETKKKKFHLALQLLADKFKTNIKIVSPSSDNAQIKSPYVLIGLSGTGSPEMQQLAQESPYFQLFNYDARNEGVDIKTKLLEVGSVILFSSTLRYVPALVLVNQLSVGVDLGDRFLGWMPNILKFVTVSALSTWFVWSRVAINNQIKGNEAIDKLEVIFHRLARWYQNKNQEFLPPETVKKNKPTCWYFKAGGIIVSIFFTTYYNVQVGIYFNPQNMINSIYKTLRLIPGMTDFSFLPQWFIDLSQDGLKGLHYLQIFSNGFLGLLTSGDSAVRQINESLKDKKPQAPQLVTPAQKRFKIYLGIDSVTAYGAMAAVTSFENNQNTLNVAGNISVSSLLLVSNALTLAVWSASLADEKILSVIYSNYIWANLCKKNPTGYQQLSSDNKITPYRNNLWNESSSSTKKNHSTPKNSNPLPGRVVEHRSQTQHSPNCLKK